MKTFLSTFEGLGELQDLYVELALKSKDFLAKAKISCPDSCGNCCSVPASQIEASVFEMLLPAWELLKRGQGETILNQLTSESSDSFCSLFLPGAKKGEGRCSLYSFRPLVCRLFGCAGWQDKYGRNQYIPCTRLRGELPWLEASTQKLLNDGLKIPLFSIYRERVYGINPLLAKELYPVNEALALALQKVGLCFSYSARD